MWKKNNIVYFLNTSFENPKILFEDKLINYESEKNFKISLQYPKMDMEIYIIEKKDNN
jgi:hypothetical protein